MAQAFGVSFYLLSETTGRVPARTSRAVRGREEPVTAGYDLAQSSRGDTTPRFIQRRTQSKLNRNFSG